MVELVEALVYRAELATRLQEPDRAASLLARVRNQTLDEAQRDQLADAAELERALHTDHAD